MDVQGVWQYKILVRLSAETTLYNPIHYVQQVKAPVLTARRWDVLEMNRVNVQGGWQNRILARLSNEMSRYNPIHYVPQVKAPVLMVATTKDALCSIHVARKAASLNPLVKLVEKDAGKGLSSPPNLMHCARCSAKAYFLSLLQTVTRQKNSLVLES